MTITASEYTGEQKRTLEVGFGLAIGTHIPSTAAPKAGCSVRSSVTSEQQRRGSITVTFEVVIKGFPAAMLNPIIAACNSLTATQFVLAAQEAKVKLAATSVSEQSALSSKLPSSKDTMSGELPTMEQPLMKGSSNLHVDPQPIKGDAATASTVATPSTGGLAADAIGSGGTGAAH